MIELLSWHTMHCVLLQSAYICKLIGTMLSFCCYITLFLHSLVSQFFILLNCMGALSQAQWDWLPKSVWVLFTSDYLHMSHWCSMSWPKFAVLFWSSSPRRAGELAYQNWLRERELTDCTRCIVWGSWKSDPIFTFEEVSELANFAGQVIFWQAILCRIWLNSRQADDIKICHSHCKFHA
jgi:hypothetical protein